MTSSRKPILLLVDDQAAVPATPRVLGEIRVANPLVVCGNGEICTGT